MGTIPNKTELCVASNHFFPTHGGVTLRFLQYFPGLRSRGVYANVLAGTPKTSKHPETEMPEKWSKFALGEILPKEEYEGTAVTRIRLPNDAGEQRTQIFCEAILDFCQQNGYQPHVLQFLGSLPPRTRPWLKRLRSLGFPIVYAYTTQPPKLPTKWTKRLRHKFEYRMLYKQLDRVIAQSSVMKQLVRSYGVRVPIEIIPNGVNLQRFRPPANSAEKRSLRASLGLPDNCRIITTVGSVTPIKGSDLLLEAWIKLASRFADTHILIIGTLFDVEHAKQGEFRRKIDGLVTASGAADRIHFSDFVPNVEDYLRISDLFVFPSIKEAMPNAVLEAMASGVASILTPFVSLPDEFGKPDSEYLLVERNPDALAAAIAMLLNKDELRSNIGRQGRKWVENTMDVELILDRYAALYHKLADQAYNRHSDPRQRN
jgi:glycosyltransferase involved in cell wall biosynthesis